jgi:hypothetical protein
MMSEFLNLVLAIVAAESIMEFLHWLAKVVVRPRRLRDARGRFVRATAQRRG